MYHFKKGVQRLLHCKVTLNKICREKGPETDNGGRPEGRMLWVEGGQHQVLYAEEQVCLESGEVLKLLAQTGRL